MSSLNLHGSKHILVFYQIRTVKTSPSYDSTTTYKAKPVQKKANKATQKSGGHMAFKNAKFELFTIEKDQMAAVACDSRLCVCV